MSVLSEEGARKRSLFALTRQEKSAQPVCPERITSALYQGHRSYSALRHASKACPDTTRKSNIYAGCFLRRPPKWEKIRQVPVFRMFRIRAWLQPCRRATRLITALAAEFGRERSVPAAKARSLLRARYGTPRRRALTQPDRYIRGSPARKRSLFLVLRIIAEAR